MMHYYFTQDWSFHMFLKSVCLKLNLPPFKKIFFSSSGIGEQDPAIYKQQVRNCHGSSTYLFFKTTFIMFKSPLITPPFSSIPQLRPSPFPVELLCLTPTSPDYLEFPKSMPQHTWVGGPSFLCIPSSPASCQETGWVVPKAWFKCHLLAFPLAGLLVGTLQFS